MNNKDIKKDNEKYNECNNKFPLWLFIILIILIISTSLGILFVMKQNKNNKFQNFGFRFY